MAEIIRAILGFLIDVFKATAQWNIDHPTVAKDVNATEQDKLKWKERLDYFRSLRQ